MNQMPSLDSKQSSIVSFNMKNLGLIPSSYQILESYDPLRPRRVLNFKRLSDPSVLASNSKPNSDLMMVSNTSE